MFLTSILFKLSIISLLSTSLSFILMTLPVAITMITARRLSFSKPSSLYLLFSMPASYVVIEALLDDIADHAQAVRVGRGFKGDQHAFGGAVVDQLFFAVARRAFLHDQQITRLIDAGDRVFQAHRDQVMRGAEVVGQ